MNPKTINLITNIVAFLLAILEPARAYLTSQPFDWTTFALCIGGAIIGYYTSKSTLITTKKDKEADRGRA